MAQIERHAGLLLAVLTCVFTGQVLAVSTHIMPPLKTGAQEVALIFIPGAQIDGMAYEDTARAIQQASNMSLWVALTKDYILNTPNPAELPGAVEGAIEDLKEAGVTTDNFVGIAHSLGGVFLGPYARNSPLKAVVFLGSYLTRGNPLGEYPLPLLTLSGELDGQTRITRIAATFKELESLVEKSPNSIYSKPVLNIKGSSHAQFASGPMPSAVKKYDLEPEISIDEAHRRIGHYVSSFVTVQFSNDEHQVAEGKANMSKSYVDSQSRFKPFLDVSKIDQSETVSPWAITMQELIASQTKNISGIKVVDRIEQYMEFVESKPSINRSNDEILIRTTSYLSYPSNPIDISTIPESPQEIQVKMKSFESLQVARGLIRSHSFSKNTTCKQLNQAAIGVAFNHSSPDAQRRYKAKGRPIILQDDVEYQTGIQWVATNLHLTEDDSGLAVQSVSLYTSMHSPILPGMYYCKSLAPYRAMEWINVDSLRKHKP